MIIKIERNFQPDWFPFSTTTIIKYRLPEASFVTLKVYDVLGSEVATLVSKEKAIENYKPEFDVTNLLCGVYFYRIQARNFLKTKKWFFFISNGDNKILKELVV